MRDIAARAGVSIGTVSRVINGKSDVSPDLALRVTQEARHLGYEIGNRPSRSEAALGAVGYLVDMKSEVVMADAFQHDFLSGVEQRVTELGGHVIFAAYSDELMQNTLPGMISGKAVNGIILKGGAPEAWLEKVNSSVPIVTMMHTINSRSIPSIMCDNRTGMYQVLRYLRELGHTRIGWFFENHAGAGSDHHVERQTAFCHYLPILGCEFRPEYLQTPWRDVATEELVDVAKIALKNMFALGKARPTAVVCASDVHAFSVMRAAAELNLRLPDDLSVASFMNTTPCEYAVPSLTSVSLSPIEMGAAAVDLLRERIGNPNAITRHVLVGTKLVERLSCARLQP